MFTMNLAHQTSNGMIESALHAHRLLLRVGLSLAHIFAWIFVFEYFFVLTGSEESVAASAARAIAATVALYGFAQLITIIATPMSAAHLQRGVRRSIIWGVLSASAAFVFLGGALSGYFNTPALWGVVAFAVLLGLYRALYWVPYTISRTDQPHMHMRAYLEVLVAFMPLFAGLTISSVAFAEGRLLFGAAALLIISLLPLAFLTDTRERYSWSYVYTFKQLFREKNHGLVLQSILEGLQGTALFLIWPLAIFLIFEWSYLTLGLVFTLTLLFILLLRRLYRWMMRSSSLGESPTVHTVLAVSGWIARLAAGTPAGVIVANVYAFTTDPERGTHFDPASFEHVSDRGAFLDEYTALKEIGAAAGRIMLCGVVFFITPLFPVVIVFGIALVVAALAAGLAVLIARRESAPVY